MTDSKPHLPLVPKRRGPRPAITKYPPGNAKPMRFNAAEAGPLLRDAAGVGVSAEERRRREDEARKQLRREQS